MELMIARYSSNPALGWVAMDEIIQKTLMSSFNQRFQQWRDRGIVITNRMLDGKSKYKLFTHPDDIDRERFSCKAVQVGMEF